jgi:hypothetical protein
VSHIGLSALESVVASSGGGGGDSGAGKRWFSVAQVRVRYDRDGNVELPKMVRATLLRGSDRGGAVAEVRMALRAVL